MVSNYFKERIYLIVLTLLISCSEEREWAAVEEVPGSSRLSELLRDDATSGFPRAIEPRTFSFPADHGPHREYRNEWWYLTGNLDGPGGERFGYELTIFRFALSPSPPAGSESTWKTNQVYIGHFAVTDVPGSEFHVAQRYSRAHPGLAGASADPFRVWIDDWQIAAAGDAESWRLEAGQGDFALSLTLKPRKEPVLNGVDGLSRKSAEIGNASYYYSIPRLESAGTLVLGDREYEVTGTSWLDREWGSSALAADQQGWDWFALQLSDGTDLMYYQIRGTDGQVDQQTAGTRIAADGSYEYLRYGDVSLVVTGSWESELGGTYPAGWTIEIPSENTSLTVVPVLENQELVTNVRYWEGAVDVTGTSSGRSVTGRGYVELTGYASVGPEQ